MYRTPRLRWFRQPKPRNRLEGDVGAHGTVYSHIAYTYRFELSVISQTTSPRPAEFSTTPYGQSILYSIEIRISRLRTVFAMDASFPSCPPNWISLTPMVSPRDDGSEERQPIPTSLHKSSRRVANRVCALSSVFHPFPHARQLKSSNYPPCTPRINCVLCFNNDICIWL